MSKLEWRRLHIRDQQRLSEARLHSHYAAQWLARTARGYVPMQFDDSHTNLGWDSALAGLVTHPLPDGTRFILAVAEARLVLIDPSNASPAAELRLDGQTDAHVRAWLGQHSSAKNLDASALDQPLPYSIPPHPLAEGAAYSAAALMDALADLAAWYGNADLVLGRTQQRLVEQGFKAPPVRCWPHHFDLDTLIVFPTRDIYDTRMMGVGFSPGDEYYNEPYFYVSIYPAPDVTTLPPLPAIGHWHTHEFTAAVATASHIVAADDQQAETEAFLDAAAAIAVETLTANG